MTVWKARDRIAVIERREMLSDKEFNQGSSGVTVLGQRGRQWTATRAGVDLLAGG